MQKIATFITKVHPNARGDMRLYKLNPAMEEEKYEWQEDDRNRTHEYVVVSEVNAMFSGPETFIFPADEAGKITSWGELDGSFRGAKDHKRALQNAGYVVEGE